MEFKLVDINTWKRKEYFNHYYAAIPCTYSMTVKLDVTRVKEAGKKLYPTLLHAISTVVNLHNEFRTAFNSQGELGIYDVMYPCYTVFHKETEMFSNIWTPYFESYDSFVSAYENDLARYGAVEKMEAKPESPENTFPVSMLPWESFESFNLNLQKGYDYLLPIFTIGKYSQENGRYVLPLTIQVHHAVCDGFHVCRFIAELREILQA